MLSANITSKDHPGKKLWVLKVEKVERLYKSLFSDQVTYVLLGSARRPIFAELVTYVDTS